MKAAIPAAVLALLLALPAEGASNGGLVDVIANTLSMSSSAVVAPAFTVRNLYGIPRINGGISHNRPEEESTRLRGIFSSTIEAMSATKTIDLVFWFGVFLPDGTSFFAYPTNNSWIGRAPKKYNEQKTNGYSWEQPTNVSTTNCHPCRYDAFWLGREAEILEPEIAGKNFMFDASTRPHYNYFRTYGDGWFPDISGWSYNAQFLCGAKMYDNDGNYTGSAINAIKLGLLEKELVGAIKDAGGQPGKNTWIFVLDERGKLVISSAGEGVAYTCPGWYSCVSNLGNETSEATIRATVLDIQQRQGQTTTATFLLGETIVQTKFISNLGGMPLEVGWLIVAVEKIDCPPNHYYDSGDFTCKICIPPFSSRGGAVRKCGICEAGFFMTDQMVCEECPEGATCDGSSSTATLLLKPGYWRISKKSTDLIECPWSEGCVGGAGANASGYCADGYSDILCASCGKQFYYSKDADKCTDCGDSDIHTVTERVRASIVLSILFFLLIISFGGLLISRFAPGLIRESALNKLYAISDWLFKLRKKAKLRVKILMSFAQIAANVSFNCGMKFPSTVETMSNVFSLANVEIIPPLGLPCWIKQFDYMDTLLSYTLGPILLMVAIMGMFVIKNSGTLFKKKEATAAEKVQRPKFTKAELKEMYLLPDEVEACFTRFELKGIRKTFAFFDRNGGGTIDVEETCDLVKNLIKREITKEDVELMFKEAKGLGPNDEMESEEIDFRAFVDMTQRAREKDELVALSLLADEVEAEAYRSNASSYIYAILFLSFLMLPGTTSTIINFFKCHEFDVPGGKKEYYMYSDYTISCESDRYQSYVGYAILMIFVYPIGIPLTWSVMLHRSRNTLLDDGAMKREAMFGKPKTGHLSFLVESYLPKYYYFEVLECVRRILLTSAIGLADKDSETPPLLGILISLVYVFIFSELKPYNELENSVLAIILMYTITVIFLAALVVKPNTVSSDDPAFAALLMTTLFGGLGMGLLVSVYGTDPFNAKAKRIAAEKAAQLAALRTKVKSMWQVVNGGSNKGEIERLACWDLILADEELASIMGKGDQAKGKKMLECLKAIRALDWTGDGTIDFTKFQRLYLPWNITAAEDAVTNGLEPEYLLALRVKVLDMWAEIGANGEVERLACWDFILADEEFAGIMGKGDHEEGKKMLERMKAKVALDRSGNLKINEAEFQRLYLPAVILAAKDATNKGFKSKAAKTDSRKKTNVTGPAVAKSYSRKNTDLINPAKSPNLSRQSALDPIVAKAYSRKNSEAISELDP